MATTEAWRRRAACRGMAVAVFFPAPGEDDSVARLVCSGCVVRVECLAYALAHPEVTGIWAETTATERRALRRAATAGSQRHGLRRPHPCDPAA